MKIAGSVLDIKPKTREEILKFCSSGIDYLHLDIMDGIFVSNISYLKSEEKALFKDIKIPLIIHLMVSNITKYINYFKELNPDYIIFHYEATSDIQKVIDYLKEMNIKVGIAISPDTSLSLIEPYLNSIDMVLVMSVYPGLGRQAFIEDSTLKINDLLDIKLKKEYDFLISVDGGINKDTIKKIGNVDIAVIGSFLTSNNDYCCQLKILKGE